MQEVKKGHVVSMLTLLDTDLGFKAGFRQVAKGQERCEGSVLTCIVPRELDLTVVGVRQVG